MTSRELMDAALVKTKTTQAGLARQMGWTPQNFNLRLNRNSKMCIRDRVMLDHGFDIHRPYIEDDGKHRTVHEYERAGAR